MTVTLATSEHKIQRIRLDDTLAEGLDSSLVKSFEVHFGTLVL